MDTYNLVVLIISGTLVGLGAPFIAYVVIQEKREERRRAPRSPEEIFIGMRERKHDTMRRMREVVRNHRRD
ncbi:hypothetical protein STRIP9103_01228 [Streptomyces ipomoeae 91-03]|uniref:Uncharacterized protein n=1 Tax=Streptomyces ipomoeae 91-03 TaxID=698759 RepID=L1KIG8_9ACTN|nr:hypothetical protein STRIP9103_01228 [Streptomyces ipomoeae 91-03]